MFEKIYEEIFKIDPKIRYIGIYREGDLHGKVKDGVKGYLNRYETKLSLYQAAIRWKERKDWAPKIGKPIYALAVYEKVKRMTIEVDDNFIIFISTEIDCESEKVLSQLIKFKKQIKDTIS